MGADHQHWTGHVVIAVLVVAGAGLGVAARRGHRRAALPFVVLGLSWSFGSVAASPLERRRPRWMSCIPWASSATAPATAATPARRRPRFPTSSAVGPAEADVAPELSRPVTASFSSWMLIGDGAPRCGGEVLGVV